MPPSRAGPGVPAMPCAAATCCSKSRPTRRCSRSRPPAPACWPRSSCRRGQQGLEPAGTVLGLIASAGEDPQRGGCRRERRARAAPPHPRASRLSLGRRRRPTARENGLAARPQAPTRHRAAPARQSGRRRVAAGPACRGQSTRAPPGQTGRHRPGRVARQRAARPHRQDRSGARAGGSRGGPADAAPRRRAARRRPGRASCRTRRCAA